MPKGPKGEKRPADVIGNAVKVMRIAIGEEQEQIEKTAKEAGVAIGRIGGLKGGKVRAARLSPSKRSEIARKAASTRWAAKTK